VLEVVGEGKFVVSSESPGNCQNERIDSSCALSTSGRLPHNLDQWIARRCAEDFWDVGYAEQTENHKDPGHDAIDEDCVHDDFPYDVCASLRLLG
jgi:hypothetical protein